MAAGNGAGFAPPASAPLRGGGRGAGRFGGTRREGGLKGFVCFFFKVPPGGQSSPHWVPSSIAGRRAARRREEAQRVGADPETASRDATDPHGRGTLSSCWQPAAVPTRDVDFLKKTGKSRQGET